MDILLEYLIEHVTFGLFYCMFKGSNMIVCVLLVSDSRRCCLAPWGDNTRGSLTPTIHTQSCLIPIITWCHHFFSSATNILLIKSNLKRETERVKLNCARPASSASRGDNEVEFQMHTVQWKLQVLHTYGISVVKQVGMFFDGIACLMKVWPLFKREFPLVPKTWRAAHARISNVTSHLKQIDPHWFQGRQMRLWWMVSTISWE